MKITVRFLGILSDYFRTPKVELQLPSEATQRDLLKALGNRFGKQLSKKLWNNAENRFLVGVHMAGKNGDIDDPDTPLSDNDEINILLPIAGG
jgi:molybdopterin converting factor small subunit